METRKKIIIGIVVAGLLFYLAAGFFLNRKNGLMAPGSGTETTADNHASPESNGAAPGGLSSVLGENLYLEAEIPPQPQACAEYTVDLAEFPAEKGGEFLESQGIGNIYTETYNEDSYLVGSDDGARFFYVDGGICFERAAQIDDEIFSVASVWTDEHKDGKKQEELSFSSQEDAARLVRDALGQFTDTGTRVTEILSVRQDELEDMYRQFQEEGGLENAELTDFDSIGDIYLLYICFEQDGLPLFQCKDEPMHVSYLEWDTAMPSGVEAVVSRDGIRYLNVNVPYQVKEKKEVALITAREALTQAQKPLENLILDQPAVFTDIYLEYVLLSGEDLIRPARMRPYWTFLYECDGARHALRINAVTGGDLANGN